MNAYPAFKWTSTGDTVLVNGPADDDPTYLDHHPDDPMKATIAAIDAVKMDRNTVAELLNAGNITFDPAADDDALRSLLAAGLKDALVHYGISFGTDDSVEQLYALVQTGAK